MKIRGVSNTSKKLRKQHGTYCMDEVCHIVRLKCVVQKYHVSIRWIEARNKLSYMILIFLLY